MSKRRQDGILYVYTLEFLRLYNTSLQLQTQGSFNDISKQSQLSG